MAGESAVGAVRGAVKPRKMVRRVRWAGQVWQGGFCALNVALNNQGNFGPQAA